MKGIQKIILAFMLGIVPIQSAWAADSIVKRMVFAAFSGDLESLKPLVKICKEVVCLNELYTTENISVTALMAASMKGNLEVVKYLLDKGAYVNAENEQGFTALIWASSEGHLEIVKYLISKGANIDSKDSRGNTALMFASLKGYLEIVKYLVNKGANVNARNFADRTALSVAKTNEIKKVLLNAR